jgi:RNA recognition motif-containing protein
VAFFEKRRLIVDLYLNEMLLVSRPRIVSEGGGVEILSDGKRNNSRKGVWNMKIYVGNLSHDVTEEELKQEFMAFGEVTSASIVTDRYTGQPRGFAFVEMAKVSEGQAAVKGLNGKTLKDQTVKVDEARPRADTRGGGFGGGGRQRRY